MILNDSILGPYISQFSSDDQGQPLVGSGGVEAPGLTNEINTKFEVIVEIQSRQKTSSVFTDTLIEICNLLKLTSDTCLHTMRLCSR